MSLPSHLSGLALGLAVLLSPLPTRAALGEAEASIARDRHALSAIARGATDRGAYSVHELAAGATTVREYVSPDGVVFAVAWSGLARPDLRLLLGAYHEEYHQAAGEAPRVRGRRARRVAAAHLVVDHWGHMRDLHGRAYLPDLVPQGVSIDEIR